MHEDYMALRSDINQQGCYNSHAVARMTDCIAYRNSMYVYAVRAEAARMHYETDLSVATPSPQSQHPNITTKDSCPSKSINVMMMSPIKAL